MKAYWGSGGTAPIIIDLGTRWRWVVSSTPRLLYPQGKSPLCPLVRRLAGPRAGWDAVMKRKIPRPCRFSNPRSSSPQSSTVPLSYPVSLYSTYSLSLFKKCWMWTKFWWLFSLKHLHPFHVLYSVRLAKRVHM